MLKFYGRLDFLVHNNNNKCNINKPGINNTANNISPIGYVLPNVF